MKDNEDESNLKKIFGENVKYYREEVQDIEQSQLAHDSGCSVTYLSGIENGKANPSLTKMERISKALKKDLPYMLQKHDHKKNKPENPIP